MNATESPWILGGGRRDGLLILCPGLIALALSVVLPVWPRAYSLLLLASFAFIDSGHVYTTAWRTFLRREERESSPLYWRTPLIAAGGVGLWYWLQLPFLWSFITYATVFHHVRQFYGFLRWYETLNARRCIWSARFLYGLCVLPLVIFHFRPDGFSLMYDGDVFLAPRPALHHAALVAYRALLAGWLAFELGLLRRGVREWNRLLAVAVPAALYSCALWFKSADRLLFVMVVAHGVPYLAVMGLSLRRLAPASYAALPKLAATLLGTAVIFGGLENWFEVGVLPTFEASPASPWQGLVVGAYLTPLLCHYVFDARIWRAKHRESRIVYAAGSSRRRWWE